MIKIKLKPNDNLPIWQSKIGGTPYLPLTHEFPCSEKGNPLILIAQINCSELPKNDELPTTGIISFFVEDDGYLMGMDANNQIENCDQKNYRVLYFDELTNDSSQLWQDFSEMDKKRKPTDYPIFRTDKQYEIFFESATDGIEKVESYLLGEPCFVQGDDRYEGSEDSSGIWEMLEYSEEKIANLKRFNRYELLLQLTTDKEAGFTWAHGVGYFLIHPDDLKVKDFSKVAFVWQGD